MAVILRISQCSDKQLITTLLSDEALWADERSVGALHLHLCFRSPLLILVSCVGFFSDSGSRWEMQLVDDWYERPTHETDYRFDKDLKGLRCLIMLAGHPLAVQVVHSIWFTTVGLFVPAFFALFPVLVSGQSRSAYSQIFTFHFIYCVNADSAAFTQFSYSYSLLFLSDSSTFFGSF